MHEDVTTQTSNPNQLPIVIAGGGISGMYCALKLAQRPNVGSVVLLEAAKDRWGGRIETAEIDGFIAEMGPMRFEEALQPMFKELVDSLDIPLVPFTGPSAGLIDFPVYGLARDEYFPNGGPQLNSLQLLRRGVLLIMGQELHPDDPAGARHQTWLDQHEESDYAKLRQTARLDRTPLWKMGFWNALSAPGILSHQALMKIRDTGTFYHMIPDNLNAVEWTIWWMRALKTKGVHMQSLRGGSSVLTTRLMDKLKATQKVTLVPGATLQSFTARQGAVEYKFRLHDNPHEQTAQAQRLILAMPQAPLLKLAGSMPGDIARLLDSVNGFPMIKVFFATQDPWWTEGTPPQTRAHHIPTREVHYFYRAQPRGGMVLIYTDRPATEYWKVYVPEGTHDRAAIYRGDENPDLKKQFARFLAKEAMEALQKDADSISPAELGLTDTARTKFAGLDLDQITTEISNSVTQYAIRDWARAPYGAANHSWKPGVESEKVQHRLKAFALTNGAPENVHICGEAYSDYSGFIEGALRSAKLTLDSISVAQHSTEE